MNSTVPASTLLLQIVIHTPAWAWGVLAGLVALGVFQMADRPTNRARLVIVPIALGIYSLWGTTQSFGLSAAVLVAWFAGWTVAAGLQQRSARPGETHLDAAGHIVLRGSVRPLLGMVSIFALRYVTAVTQVIDPALAHGVVFADGMSLAYGVLSGLFAGRAIRVLRRQPRSAPAPMVLAAA